MEYVKLNNGVEMPILGFGVYQIPKEETKRCVLDALKVGYRSIDTAQSYFNEKEVGDAIKECGIPREKLFITTKVWIDNYGYENCKKSVLESLEKLQTEYIDLVLLHQPFADYYGAYRALEDLYEEGKIKAIGVSNFYPDRLSDICLFERKVIPGIYIGVIECDLKDVTAKSEFPLRSVEDVPFLNVYEQEDDEVPFDISDIIADRKARRDNK